MTDWVEEAKRAQKEMAQKVIAEDQIPPLRWVGGVDVSHNLYDPAQMIYAAVVVLDPKTLEVVEEAVSVEKQTIPYVPGLLGFRETPALCHAWEKLRLRPDVLLVDGHGISHPRRLGIASHLGVLLDAPTIGVAKSILIGKPAGELGANPGDQVPLVWQKEQIGIVYRSKKRAQPLILSPGHKVCFATAEKLVASCLRGYRLPEPTRRAHLAANACRKQFGSIG